jgi:short-subunit dehydrogenase
MMEAPDCARYAVDALRKGSATTIPGPSNNVLATLMRSFPKSLVLPVVERIYRAGVNK